MKLIINDTEYNFRFGIGFVRHLDGESSIRQNGITFGVGLESMVTKLTMKDTVALSDTLAAANMTECPRVQTADIGRLASMRFRTAKEPQNMKARRIVIWPELG